MALGTLLQCDPAAPRLLPDVTADLQTLDPGFVTSKDERVRDQNRQSDLDDLLDIETATAGTSLTERKPKPDIRAIVMPVAPSCCLIVFLETESSTFA
jgi:hypothetical protein